LSNQPTKTNNTNLNAKVYLRTHFLDKQKEYKVLDCYHGTGEIWNSVKNKGYNIFVVGIDKKENATIKGDNLKVLPTIDLEQFDIIDLDAYGMPIKQLEIIFSKVKTEKIIYVTYIQTLFGSLDRILLEKIGYTKEMIVKCPTLFFKNAFNKLVIYLTSKGIKDIYYIEQSSNKYYISFKINPA
jgi:hypothetical protein